MNYIKIVLILFFSLISFSGSMAQSNKIKPEVNNLELEQMMVLDQKIREDSYEGSTSEIDEKHRLRVFELLADGKILTKQDKFNAAIILQHTNAMMCDGKLKSTSPENYYLAYCIAKSGFGESNIAATTYDRYLVFTTGIQKFGTQKYWDEEKQALYWNPIDKNTTDEERIRNKVKPLLELLKECPIGEGSQ